eukprot:scaffold57995_cov72-Phaeocystis_antarctica.AAC.1
MPVARVNRAVSRLVRALAVPLARTPLSFVHRAVSVPAKRRVGVGIGGGCDRLWWVVVGYVAGCGGLVWHCSRASRAGALAHALSVALAVHPLARKLVAVFVAG